MQVNWHSLGQYANVTVDSCDQSGMNCTQAFSSDLGNGSFDLWLCQGCYLQVSAPGAESITIFITTPGNGVPFLVVGAILFVVGVYIKRHRGPKTVSALAGEFA